MMRVLRNAVRRAHSVRRPSTDGQPFFFEPIRSGDTYLVSFPRSGNTFLRHLVASLVLDRAPAPREIATLVPDVHRTTTSARPPGGGPLVAKSHAPVRSIPANVVYLVRDGRAALLSYYVYLQQRGRPTPAEVDAMLEWPDVWPCPWPQHVSGWLSYLATRDRSLVLRYEDLVAEPARALREVATLAEIPWTDGAIERAVEHSSVDAMRTAEGGDTPGSLNFVGTTRRGWPETFSGRALARFEAGSRPLLTRLGYPVASETDG